MALYMLVVSFLLVTQIKESQPNGLLFTRIAKAAADAGESLCGNFTRGNTLYLQVKHNSTDEVKLVSGTLHNTWRGFVGLINGSDNVMNVTGTRCGNLTGMNISCGQQCYMINVRVGNQSSSTLKCQNETMCSEKALIAYRMSNKTWISQCLPVPAGNRTIDFRVVHGVRTDVEFRRPGMVRADGTSEGEGCDSEVVSWVFKTGCNDFKDSEWKECVDGAWGLANTFTFGARSVHWISELEVNSNHMLCKVNKLANLTTNALRLLNQEEGDLREATLDNRLALEMLLARQGGLCKYIGRQTCCTEVSDFQRNISEILDKMHEEIARYHDEPVKYGLDLGLNSLLNWLHWLQWLPIFILLILACMCLRR